MKIIETVYETVINRSSERFPMLTINDLAVRLQKKMKESADTLAKESGFVQRSRKVSGSNFVQSLNFGWLASKQASLTKLVSSARMRDLEISPQGLGKRFTESAAKFCQALLEEMLKETVLAKQGVEMRIAYQKQGRSPTERSLELCGWSLLITNVPVDKLTLNEALVLYGSRWQIELIFKLWKQHMNINQSASKNPWRILCELYLKLMAALVQHWIVLSSPCWQLADKSLIKAYKVISSHALYLSSTFDCLTQLTTALENLGKSLATICRQNSRKNGMNTWKKLIFKSPQWA